MSVTNESESESSLNRTRTVFPDMAGMSIGRGVMGLRAVGETMGYMAGHPDWPSVQDR